MPQARCPVEAYRFLVVELVGKKLSIVFGSVFVFLAFLTSFLQDICFLTVTYLLYTCSGSPPMDIADAGDLGKWLEGCWDAFCRRQTDESPIKALLGSLILHLPEADEAVFLKNR